MKTLEVSPSQLEVTVVNKSEMLLVRRNRWLNLLIENLEKLKGIEKDEALRIPFETPYHVNAFMSTARAYLAEHEITDVEMSGSTRRLCAFMARK